MKRMSLVLGTVAAGLLLAGAAVASDTASYEVVDGGIQKSLTGSAGNADAGRDSMINRKQGNCLACHLVTTLSEQPFHGEVGPPLDGVADRWNEAELRLIVVDSKKVFEGTIMPAFHRTTGLNRVAGKFKDKPILSAQQVEDIVAYLKTLKEE